MLTTFLTRAEVSRRMQALHLLNEVKQAFAVRGVQQTVDFDVPGHAPTSLRLATHPGIPAWSLTVKTDQPADSKVSGTVVQLFDAESGKLLALMDGGHLTTLRASIVGALAADMLARSDATNVALLGGGPAVSSALKALRLVRSLERVTLFDEDLAASTEQAMKLQATLSARVKACETVEEAVALADVVVLTGSVPLPIDCVRDGAHVTVMSAERWQKSPLPESLLARARCFSDDKTSLPWAPALQGELSQVLSSAVAPRASVEQVTVFLSTGPPFLDLVAAWHVCEGAKHDEAVTRLNLDA